MLQAPLWGLSCSRAMETAQGTMVVSLFIQQLPGPPCSLGLGQFCHQICCRDLQHEAPWRHKVHSEIWGHVPVSAQLSSPQTELTHFQQDLSKNKDASFKLLAFGTPGFFEVKRFQTVNPSDNSPVPSSLESKEYDTSLAGKCTQNIITYCLPCMLPGHTYFSLDDSQAKKNLSHCLTKSSV